MHDHHIVVGYVWCVLFLRFIRLSSLSFIRSCKNATNRTLIGHGGHARWLVVYYRCEQLPGTTHLCCGERVCSAFTYIDVV